MLGNNKTLAIVLIVVVLAAVAGGVLVFLRNQTPPEAVPTPTPAAQAPTPSLTLQPSTTAMTASQSASIDVFLNTNGAKINGFQFILTISGSANTDVTDADPAATGIQIQAPDQPSLSVATNNVTDQSGKKVIRYAMVTTDPTKAFPISGNIQVARILLTPNNAGSLIAEFSAQNTRANLVSNNDEIAVNSKDTTLAVAAGTPLLANSGATSTPVPTASSSATRAPAVTTPTASASATPRATATPPLASSGATPKATPRVVAASSSALPVTGGLEDTLLLVAGGFLLLGLGFFILGDRSGL
ncbi:MAG TPA: hypothetical protein VLH19_03200 [Patescibacteria group bacterium]|nr:hypothetical protein [Patescibacteria group bacterium]